MKNKGNFFFETAWQSESFLPFSKTGPKIQNDRTETRSKSRLLSLLGGMKEKVKYVAARYHSTESPE
uniref:Uncharacterized protein n=1 Tax=Utricularia reniformis TaxID=192314 RepID=A0A1Y0AYS9_9LAMI|nr:hypothetical protein AEK19_MT0810 [Utricularia reniformis]ART30316.1 hypothetical protein AEK19_MT0810 [Utricularia reniformis]